ncbi:MAG: hypothetical protein PHC97_01250 [Patescibacteria group bacterium]|nr:hypothetical protein [Patescibacteria group bacterium]
MGTRNLKDLENIEKHLDHIKSLLNPEDSPYICDTIVTNIGDEMLVDLIMDMLINMGYKNKMILKVAKIIKQIQA